MLEKTVNCLTELALISHFQSVKQSVVIGKAVIFKPAGWSHPHIVSCQWCESSYWFSLQNIRPANNWYTYNSKPRHYNSKPVIPRMDNIQTFDSSVNIIRGRISLRTVGVTERRGKCSGLFNSDPIPVSFTVVATTWPINYWHWCVCVWLHFGRLIIINFFNRVIKLKSSKGLILSL